MNGRQYDTPGLAYDTPGVTYDGPVPSAPTGGKRRGQVRVTVDWTLEDDDAEIVELLAVLLDRT